jgi:hypothetical protein
LVPKVEQLQVRLYLKVYLENLYLYTYVYIGLTIPNSQDGIGKLFIYMILQRQAPSLIRMFPNHIEIFDGNF